MNFAVLAFRESFLREINVTNPRKFPTTCIRYRIAGKFGGELNLAVWRSAFATAKLKSAKISYLRIYVWRSRTEPPN